MLARITGALSTRFHPVHVARTEEERAAIFRQRYEIYVGEKNETALPGADHERREVRTPEDDLPDAALFYVGTPPDIAGSLRVRSWGPGQIPADIYRRYSLDRFPDVHERAVCHVGFLMAPKTLRGTASVVGLTCGAVDRTVAEHRVELTIADCAPGLLAAYARLGLRPFGGRLLSLTRGMQIPVAGVVGDLEHLRRCGSPWYPVVSRLVARGEGPSLDFAGLLPPFERPGVETHPDRVLAAVQAALAARPSPFLSRLRPATLARLVRKGLVLEVDPGVDVVAEGYANRDMFVVLSGQLELRVGGVPVAVLGAGDVLGEVAYFRESGQRSGSLHSLERCKLLHFRHGVLRRFVAKHPTDGLAIYASLAQVLADRLAAWGSGGRSVEAPRSTPAPISHVSGRGQAA